MANNSLKKNFMRKLKKILSMDLYDYINFSESQWAKIKTLIWYNSFFGRIGPKSYIKKPQNIQHPSDIFIGAAVRIEKNATLYAVHSYGNTTYQGRVQIGDRTFLNNNAKLISAFNITIGNDVAFGHNVFVSDFDHEYELIGVSRLDTPLRSKGKVIIGDRCWIGTNACITSGVVLGHDCVVGANSVVTSSFPPYTVIAGIPARAIKRYDISKKQWIRISEAESTHEC